LIDKRPEALQQPRNERRPDREHRGRPTTSITDDDLGNYGDETTPRWGITATPTHQLGGPIVLIWDNLNTHVCAAMKKFIADHAWLTVYQLPTYSPDLNPTEGIWSLVRRGLANTAFADLTHLDHVIRQRLRVIQRQAGLIDGCLTGTGLVLHTEPP
jgi:hypothetical protein